MLPSLAVRLTLHTGILLIAGGLLLVLAVATAVYRRDRIGALLMAVLLVGTLWCVSVVFQLSTSAPAEMIVWYKLRSSATTFTSLFTFLFVAAYTNREVWFRRRVLVAICVVPLLVNAVLWSPGLHPLLFADWAVVRVGELSAISQTPGPLSILSAAYNSSLIVAAIASLSTEVSRSTGMRTYRIQAGLLLIGITVPWIVNVLYAVGMTAIDFTPVAIAVFAVLAMVAVFRFKLLDLTPIARDVVLENMDTGAIVVDADGTITDVNPRGLEILGGERSALLGTSLQETLGGDIAFEDDGTPEVGTASDLRVPRDGRNRHFEVTASSIELESGERVGAVILLRDVSRAVWHAQKLERRTAELQRQNERLEEFAGVVSHDLRNPINVIAGRLELARETGDEDHLIAIEDNLRRMEGIVEELLELARHGQTVLETEVVDLGEAVDAAWNHVDGRGASLENEATSTVEAEEGRLLHVLENLFRNAIEHGPAGDGERTDGRSPADGITIRVGDLEDGFYVVDDGQGIDEEIEADVLDQGFSTDADGTGLGLGIVVSAADAHGWSVRITEGERGGARFEFTGVDRATHSRPPVE